jgi:membrane-associated protein
MARGLWYPSGSGSGVSGMIDFFLHLDRHVSDLIRDFGPGVYGLLFTIIFCETGLVIAPFLPGDSLLFALGVFCHANPAKPEIMPLNFWLLFFLLTSAAFLGDNLNYQIGRVFGEKLFRNEKSRFFKRSHLAKTHAFFERYGGKTLILARFVPIVRTFAPFVAGMGKMEFHKFLAYSAGGGALWVGLCMGAGFLFGQIPVVKQNFPVAMLGIVAISVIPMTLKVLSVRREARLAHVTKPGSETDSSGVE